MDALSGNGTGDNMLVCYQPKMIRSAGMWDYDNPMEYSFPLFVLQLLLIVMMCRVLHFVLKPFRQPRVVSEILGGIILGPSVLGRDKSFAGQIFPLRSIVVLETMANLGLVYFLFLVGVEMGLSVVKRIGKKAIAIAFGGMVLPFIFGCISSSFLHNQSPILDHSTYVIILGISLSVTAFPVLARILAEIKLLNKDIGQLAMSAAVINDVLAWSLLAFGISTVHNNAIYVTLFWAVFSNCGLLLICLYLARPAVKWLIKRTPEGETYSELSVCLVLGGVMVIGIISDAIGAHPSLGAFVYGLMIPNGPLRFILIEKLEDFVSGILLPLFFASSGLKFVISELDGAYNWALLLIFILLACAARVGGTILVCNYYNMSLRDGFTLGFLMNAKGLIEMIILNVAKEHKVVDEKSYTIIISTSVILTVLITPVVTIIYRPISRSYKGVQRSIQMTPGDAELRILVCTHSTRNVPTIFKLLEASKPSNRSPLRVYVLHLIELTSRASTMLFVHGNQGNGEAPLNKVQAEEDYIMTEFKNFEKQNTTVSTQLQTAISSYSSMHQDILSMAEENQVNFIIIPFHKHQTVDGRMTSMYPEIQQVNKNVLAQSNFSVAILIDKGLSLCLRIAMLFFGGQDDREALSYAMRMSENQGNSITVIRFILRDENVGFKFPEYAKEKVLDDDCIDDFRGSDQSLTYTEKAVRDGEDTVAEIRSIRDFHDLFVVGRRDKTKSPFIEGLSDWSECPELGVIGDLLASPDFSRTISVLIVQQCKVLEERIIVPSSP